MDDTSVDRLLREAIAARRLISFTLAGYDRIGEPHDYGMHKGRRRLLFYQTGGASRSGRPLGWRWAEFDQISRLEILRETFPGARASSGAHTAWDLLFASVTCRGAAST